jgi:hypothetical protein
MHNFEIYFPFTNIRVCSASEQMTARVDYVIYFYIFNKLKYICTYTGALLEDVFKINFQHVTTLYVFTHIHW